MSKKTIYTEESLSRMGLVKGEDGVWYKPKTTPQPREKSLKQEVNKHFKPIILTKHSDATELKIQWQGKDISLNSWYSSKHWTHRNKQRNEWHDFFKMQIHEPYPKFNKYSVHLEFNSRLDASNTITMIKLAEDVLQELGIIENDNNNFCVGLTITPNLEMKKKSYKLIFKKHE